MKKKIILLAMVPLLLACCAPNSIPSNNSAMNASMLIDTTETDKTKNISHYIQTCCKPLSKTIQS